VGRFLEHSRVFAFGPPERADVFMSSADWMPRNFFRRVEVMVPVEDPALRARILEEVLGTGLRDNQNAWSLQRDAVYARVSVEGPPVRSQQLLLEIARKSGDKPAGPVIRQAAAPDPLAPPTSSPAPGS
jgi:polyphosphate kinase